MGRPRGPEECIFNGWNKMSTRRAISLWRGALLLALLSLVPACASLGNVFSAPTFRVDESQQPQLRLLGPGSGRPAGGLALRLYARVNNPNPIALTLSRLAGVLELEGRQAANVDFPLGVPLAASGETLVPLDISISFSDVPGLASTLVNAATGRPLQYRLNGTFGVNAPLIGEQTFGPSTLLNGSVRVTR